MRFGNGFGSVYKLSGNRRNPWAARKTVGWKNNGQPEYFFVGYFRTRSEAFNALVAYNQNPVEKDVSKMTFWEIYEKWSEEKFDRIGENTVKSYIQAVKVFEPIYGMRFADIKLSTLQGVVDTSGKSVAKLKISKIVIGMMYEYAVIHEIIPPEKREFMRYLDVSRAKEPEKTERAVFTSDQIEALWEHQSERIAAIALILIYSGLRIGELLELKKENVNIEERFFRITKSKTAAGIRDVPIAKKILPIVTDFMEKDGDYLTGKRKIYSCFIRDEWSKLAAIAGSHTPHDTRHTCVSLLAGAGVEDRIIKQIVGHAGKDITESVYTHFDMSAKLAAIDKI